MVGSILANVVKMKASKIRKNSSLFYSTREEFLASLSMAKRLPDSRIAECLVYENSALAYDEGGTVTFRVGINLHVQDPWGDSNEINLDDTFAYIMQEVKNRINDPIVRLEFRIQKESSSHTRTLIDLDLEKEITSLSGIGHGPVHIINLDSVVDACRLAYAEIYTLFDKSYSPVDTRYRFTFIMKQYVLVKR